ncbi:hypothetical protein YC2023_100364 [Brassica napus]
MVKNILAVNPKSLDVWLILDVVDGIRSNSGTPSCSQSNSPDRIIRQKGPRIAKVVRRINCNVEPLRFRSRVRYIYVLDPTRMNFYISEILDAGRNSPLFMAIEALDMNRVCTEYWDYMPYSRPQVQFLANALLRESQHNKHTIIGCEKSPEQRLLPAGTNSTLKVLLKKANMEELSSLQEVLSESNIDLVSELVKEEIQKRQEKVPNEERCALGKSTDLVTVKGNGYGALAMFSVTFKIPA